MNDLQRSTRLKGEAFLDMLEGKPCCSTLDGTDALDERTLAALEHLASWFKERHEEETTHLL